MTAPSIAATIRSRILDLDQVDHHSSQDLPARAGAIRSRVWRSARGSVVLDGGTVPYHRFAGATHG